MPFISYAQNSEDVVLWRALRDVEKGFYVDVGATDPEVDSISCAFYERGWSGINAYPVDAYFDNKSCCVFGELHHQDLDYTLAKVADITWCDPEMIVHAARTYATTHPGCIVWGNGTDQLGNNTFQATRSLLILMGLTGNLDAPGGNVFYPAPKLNFFELWDKLPPEQEKKRLGGDRFKALNLTPYAYAHPPSLYHTILTEKPYPVKAYIVVV